MPGKRRHISSRAAKAMSQRLREFVGKNYGTWTNLEKKLGIPKATHVQWTRARNPVTPELPSLYAIAVDSGLSLDWLLFGSGSSVREREVMTPEGRVIAALEPELRQTTDATTQELDDVWARLVVYAGKQGRRSPFLMAVEGLRPLYNELLRQVRWGDSLLAQSGRMAMQLFKRGKVPREECSELVSELAREVAKHTVQREEELGIRLLAHGGMQPDREGKAGAEL